MFVVGLSLYDIVLSAIYILIIVFIAFQVKQSIPNQAYKKYFIPFIGAKIAFAIIFVLVHIYVYRGGDTFLFFAGGNFLADQILANPDKIFTYLFGNYEDFVSFTYTKNYLVVFSFKDNTSLAMSQILSIVCLLGLKQFLATTLLFSFLSSFGIWAMYATFCKIYPSLYKIFALCILFYPTIGIWGSGILKDPIIIFALGYLLKSTYELISREKILKNILYIILGAFLCFKLKPYILYTFVPAILLWVQGKISSKLSSTGNFIAFPVLVIVFASLGYFFLQTVSEGAGKYSLDNVQEVAQGFQSWHTYLAENKDQSGYSLGEFELTPLGVLAKSPEAIFVTYYRPTLFEIRNFATGLEGLQSFTLLIFTLYIFFKIGLRRFLKIMVTNPDVRAFMVFAILLGIAVGVTSYNFGALSRYKIPSLPFFTCSLAIIYYQGRKMMLKT